MECAVCMTKIKKSYKFECPFCGDNSVCISCVGTYILYSDHKIECMVCHKNFHIDFIWNIFDEDTFYQVLDKKQTMILNQQKAMLPATMPLVEEYNRRKNLIEQYTELENKYTKLENKLNNIEVKMEQILSQINDTTYKQNAKYDFKCPNQECKGYIKTDTFLCTLCGTKICKKCHMKMDAGRHRCKKSDIDTATMIKKDTKPCPTCATRIHKTEGCPQMYCTFCKTAFDWNTGRIETGIIHNPHYYDEHRNDEGYIPRVNGDIPCGGVGYPYFGLFNILSPEELHRYVVYQSRALEVQQYLTEHAPIDHLANIRVKYLMGEILDSNFKQALYDAFIEQETDENERDILNTYIACMAERFNIITTDVDLIYASWTPNSTTKEINTSHKKIKKIVADILDEVEVIFEFTRDNLKKICEKDFEFDKTFYRLNNNPNILTLQNPIFHELM